jgi:hypothetical protein
MKNIRDVDGSFDAFMAEHERKHREALAKHPPEPSLFLSRLVREHHRVRPGHIGVSAVTAAEMQLEGGLCWQTALSALRENYDEETAKEAWWWMMADPRHGWAVWNEESERWLPYCVPGYSPLCGDHITQECQEAQRNLLRRGKGKCPWGKSGKIELRGLNPTSFKVKYPDYREKVGWITTGLIDKDDPNKNVYSLEELADGRCGAAKGTAIRTIIAPPGRYYLGIDAFATGAQGTSQALMGMFDFEVGPGETVVIEPDRATGRLAIVRRNPVERAASGLAETARHHWRLGVIGGITAVIIAGFVFLERGK